MRLKGKVVIVTGAAMGIGAGCAWASAREGGKVVVADVDRATGTKTAKEIQDSGADALFVRTDVRKTSSVIGLVQATVRRYGRIDGLVNNAGTHNGLGIESLDEEGWDFILDLNLKSMYRTVKAALPELKKSSGTIVNIASMVGIIGQANSAAYTPSKAGVIGFTKATALDLGKHGIRVNAVCPGWVDTPLLQRWLKTQPNPDEIMQKTYAQHPVGRIATPEDIGKAVAFLLSDDAGFITGVPLPVDGGVTLGY
ncbi:MAG: glucose 1-dehydrogenase [Planctomycetes bacterium]|nr:glucose 1-dehydrogenase [Planctomycetota bacterium]